MSGGGSPAETGRVPLRTNEPAPTKLDNEPLNPKLSGSVSGTTANSRGLLQTEKESWWAGKSLTELLRGENITVDGAKVEEAIGVSCHVNPTG